MNKRLITFAETMARVSPSRSEIYRRMANETFPSRVQLDPKGVALVEHDVEAWIAAQIEGGRTNG